MLVHTWDRPDSKMCKITGIITGPACHAGTVAMSPAKYGLHAVPWPTSIPHRRPCSLNRMGTELAVRVLGIIRYHAEA